MLTIKKNDITITKGDTMPLHIDCLNHDGTAYEPIEGDTCRFAISVGYVGEKGYALILSVPVPLDTGDIVITAEQTGALTYMTYNYDVELVHANGYVDTFISGNLTVEGECK